MKEQKTDRYARTSLQVEHVRKLYSRIGEPLPADVIIDLYRHLGKAMELVEEATTLPVSSIMMHFAPEVPTSRPIRYFMG